MNCTNNNGRTDKRTTSQLKLKTNHPAERAAKA